MYKIQNFSEHFTTKQKQTLCFHLEVHDTFVDKRRITPEFMKMIKHMRYCCMSCGKFAATKGEFLLC